MAKRTNQAPKKPVRLVDIAEKAGVSRSAVASVVLKSAGRNVRVSEKTAERIRRVARDLGYAPNASAQRLAGKESKLIGTIIDSYAPMQRFSQLSEVERAADEFGYRVMVGQSHGEIEKIQHYANDFIANRVDGAICISHNYPDIGERVAETFLRIPNVVFLGQPLHGQEHARWVAIDHRLATQKLVEHFYSTGRRNIALYLGDPNYQDVQDRILGYRDGLAQCGLEHNEGLSFQSAAADHDPASFDQPPAGIDEMVELVRNGKLDAVLGPNDIGAMALIRGFVRRGLKVPEDVAIAGYDNLAMTAVTLPSITTIDLRANEVARLGFEILLKLIREEPMAPEEERHLLEPQLIVRESG